MFGKRSFHDQNELPGTSTIPSPGQCHKFDYHSGGASGAIYSHSTPLDSSSGLHTMEMKYGCAMDYNHHPHGKYVHLVTFPPNHWQLHGREDLPYNMAISYSLSST